MPCILGASVVGSSVGQRAAERLDTPRPARTGMVRGRAIGPNPAAHRGLHAFRHARSTGDHAPAETGSTAGMPWRNVLIFASMISSTRTVMGMP